MDFLHTWGDWVTQTRLSSGCESDEFESVVRVIATLTLIAHLAAVMVHALQVATSYRSPGAGEQTKQKQSHQFVELCRNQDVVEIFSDPAELQSW